MILKHARRLKNGRLSKVTVCQAQEALALLFPSVTCTVAPNGSDELWVKDSAGYGFALKLSAGKAGVSATIHKFTGQPPVSVTGNQASEFECIPMVDAFEVTTTVYRSDAYSQAFKSWYAGNVEQNATAGTTPNRVKHPEELGLKPCYETEEN